MDQQSSREFQPAVSATRRAILRFRDMKTLQKFAAVHASIHNHFNQGRHLYNRVNFKLNGSASMAEWRQLAA